MSELSIVEKLVDGWKDGRLSTELNGYGIISSANDYPVDFVLLKVPKALDQTLLNLLEHYPEMDGPFGSESRLKGLPRDINQKLAMAIRLRSGGTPDALQPDDAG